MSAITASGREVFEQRLGLRYIVNLPRRERERDWIAERIDDRVDFRRQFATLDLRRPLLDAGTMLMCAQDRCVEH